ncbi:hypothetical protein P0Y67_22255, partial [Photobacterium sp. SP02]|uniref:hypothetical protein n=1 Tax=Photobacterium sp. SP02 TaxID=3032280 RepID=UPI0031451FC9
RIGVKIDTHFNGFCKSGARPVRLAADKPHHLIVFQDNEKLVWGIGPELRKPLITITQRHRLGFKSGVRVLNVMIKNSRDIGDVGDSAWSMFM